MVPVHPEDHHLLGLKWNGSIFTDTTLPFGLRSASKLFSAVADTLAWAMMCNGATSFLHYLDDFLFMGPPQPGVVNRTLQIALDTCVQLNFPVATEKTTGPAEKLVFLGIEINTTANSNLFVGCIWQLGLWGSSGHDRWGPLVPTPVAGRVDEQKYCRKRIHSHRHRCRDLGWYMGR